VCSSRWAHSGGSYVINPLGETIATVPDWQEGIAVADLDLSLIDIGRLIWNPFGDDLREDLFGPALEESPLAELVEGGGVGGQVAAPAAARFLRALATAGLR